MKSLKPGLVGMGGGGGGTGTRAGSSLLASGGLTGVVLITETKTRFGELPEHTITGGGGPGSSDMPRRSEILASRSAVVVTSCPPAGGFLSFFSGGRKGTPQVCMIGRLLRGEANPVQSLPGFLKQPRLLTSSSSRNRDHRYRALDFPALHFAPGRNQSPNRL